MPPHAEHVAPAVPSIEPTHWLQGFDRHARLHPEKIALVNGSRSFTYAALETHSNRIAQQLGDSGIGAGDYVGSGFDRSVDLIATLLGILKSGAAYVPLDPGYPQARIERMIASAGLETVITTRKLASSFPGVKILVPDENSPAEKHPIIRAAGSPAYAIFTSGSTGQPKAASVFDSGFANLLDWYGSSLALGPDDRTLVISSPSFDLTQKNLFAPLLTGGTLVLDGLQTYDIPRILALIRDHGITLLNCTPSAFYPLVEGSAADGYRALATLRFAVLGGEPVSIPRLRSWLEHPSCRAEVVNSYGPTECTDICLFHRMHRGNIDRFPFVPLGREVPNVQVTIRDEALSILADGETGELCIGGACVGGGYLNDPERSANCFVNGIYRSGDLAKRLPCGNFEFRGRADYQVKVNGFRIELGEIEIALNGHGQVREAVVTAHGNKLTAHVQGTATAADLRDHLSETLPAYMIPAEFLTVEAFPLTPNGKVDRKAVAETHCAHATRLPHESPAGLESSILALWSEILGQPIVDSSANFFDLGGSSIHLAVAHVRLREMTGRDFPITDLFAHPSARAIATHLSPRQAATTSHIQNRARLARAGLAAFQRPIQR